MRNGAREGRGKTVKRHVFNVLAGVSLVLCVATVALWVRSHWIADFLSLTTHTADHGFTEYGSSSIAGSLHLVWMHSLAEPPLFGLQWERVTANLVRVKSDHRGFGFYWRPGSGSHAPIWELWFPTWLASLLFVAIASPWFWMSIKDAEVRRRSVRNCCTHCGHDLRATRERCPEWGNVARKVNPSP
jgi:hypothetical protein